MTYAHCCKQLGFVRCRQTSLYFSQLIVLEVGQLSTVNEAELHILCRELSSDSNSILILLFFMKSAEMYPVIELQAVNEKWNLFFPFCVLDSFLSHY